MENKIKWREGLERPQKRPNIATICFTPPFKKGCGLPMMLLAPKNENEPFDIVFTGSTESGEMVNLLISHDDKPAIEFLKYWIDKLYHNLHQKVAKNQSK